MCVVRGIIRNVSVEMKSFHFKIKTPKICYQMAGKNAQLMRLWFNRKKASCSLAFHNAGTAYSK